LRKEFTCRRSFHVKEVSDSTCNFNNFGQLIDRSFLSAIFNPERERHFDAAAAAEAISDRGRIFRRLMKLATFLADNALSFRRLNFQMTTWHKSEGILMQMALMDYCCLMQHSGKSWEIILNSADRMQLSIFRSHETHQE
jgi:hypothetical protein